MLKQERAVRTFVPRRVVHNYSGRELTVLLTDPLAVGTAVTLRFAPPQARESFILGGVVQWVNQVRPRADNPNPGMGIRFLNLELEDRERIVATIHTIAYLRDDGRDRAN